MCVNIGINIIRPHRVLFMHECGLLLQKLHGLCVCPCLLDTLIMSPVKMAVLIGVPFGLGTLEMKERRGNFRGRGDVVWSYCYSSHSCYYHHRQRFLSLHFVVSC